MALFRSIATVGGWTMASRVLGFVRDILIAGVFGASMGADAFFVAFKFPNFFRRLFAEGAFNAAFVPLFAGRLAEAKARAIAASAPGCLVLGADTIVACGRRVLPKSADADDARRSLTLLSGRRHRVLGGVCVIGGDAQVRHRLVTTIVSFKRLEAGEIEQYIASDEWRGKAGGYAVQGRAAVFVNKIIGSYSNVVGLPLFETAALLHGLGYSADRHG